MLTLGDRLELEDERRFVGRRRELAELETILDADSPVRVAIVYGPGGIGKSTLLRRLRRRARAAGRPVAFIDGRDGPLTSRELEERVLGGPADGERMVLIDTFERLHGLEGYLRSSVLPRLPARAAVVLAQRGEPDPGWTQGGWERIAACVELGPVAEEEARDLLRREGIFDEPDLSALIAWSRGSPLALRIGAEATRGSRAWRPGQLEDDPAVAELLVRRLIDGELDASRLDVVTVAAIARRVDGALLGEVLPGIDGDAAAEWLRSCTFAEGLDGLATLHELLRDGVHARVRALRPERERELRRRIAEHLYARAMAGESGLIPDLAELVENETLRWALGASGPGLRADDLRADDLEALAASGAAAAERGAREWLDSTVRLISEAPSCVLVARNPEGGLSGLCIWVTPASAPPAAERDPVLGPWLEYARREIPDGNVVIWRDSLDLSDRHGDQRSRVLAVMNSAAFVRSGLPNPRYAYLPIDRENAAAVAFSRQAGAVRVEGLDVRLDGRVRECHVLDHGPGGLLAAHRATVYAELGLPLSAPPEPVLTAEGVKEALRNIRRPLELARSPLARGESPVERADSVRRLFARVADEAFGADPGERLLRELLVQRYLAEPTTHEQVAELLHVSRATYFRHLRVVLDRVAEYVLQTR